MLNLVKWLRFIKDLSDKLTPSVEKYWADEAVAAISYSINNDKDFVKNFIEKRKSFEIPTRDKYLQDSLKDENEFTKVDRQANRNEYNKQYWQRIKEYEGYKDDAKTYDFYANEFAKNNNLTPIKVWNQTIYKEWDWRIIPKKELDFYVMQNIDNEIIRKELQKENKESQYPYYMKKNKYNQNIDYFWYPINQ